MHGQSHAGEWRLVARQLPFLTYCTRPSVGAATEKRGGRKTHSKKKPDPSAPCVVEWSSTDPRSASKALLRVEVPGPMGARTDADGIGKEVMKRRPPSSTSDDLHTHKKKRSKMVQTHNRDGRRANGVNEHARRAEQGFSVLSWPSAVFD